MQYFAWLLTLIPHKRTYIRLCRCPSWTWICVWFISLFHRVGMDDVHYTKQNAIISNSPRNGLYSTMIVQLYRSSTWSDGSVLHHCAMLIQSINEWFAHYKSLIVATDHHLSALLCTPAQPQVFACESKGPGWGEQRLPFSLPAAGQLSKGWGSRQVQVLHPQCQRRGDQSNGWVSRVTRAWLFYRVQPGLKGACCLSEKGGLFFQSDVVTICIFAVYRKPESVSLCPGKGLGL